MPPLLTWLTPSCGRKVVGACRGSNPVPLGGHWWCGMLSSWSWSSSGPCWPVGLQRHLTGTSRPSKTWLRQLLRQKTWAWKEFDEAKLRRMTSGQLWGDSGPPSGVLGGRSSVLSTLWHWGWGSADLNMRRCGSVVRILQRPPPRLHYTCCLWSLNFPCTR